ncbi:sensor histidine kinase [Candidatus Aalborgicola defluviihabitans]|uniref:sensor histidine kinase n=1 Tax=Candidatus Aalborgicola defluviihabitans TaxID=3386187 RepID=UPI001D489568|nr:histidine kinase [Burkholderiales bacterium]MBK6568426.1 histidine kinase [Burkholderiales bacterium]MBK7280297.1 histidine kinase [Burkholderiales bacterium]MBL0244300.1 histidine kinase [Rhodoferax sp.]
MKIDWIDKLRRGLQTIAFCLAIASIQYAFRPDHPFEPPLVYSLCIGICTWSFIDFGSQLFPSAQISGWPTGLAGKLLPVAGIALGYLVGTSLADWYFGWSSFANASRQQLILSGLISAIVGVVVTYYFFTQGKNTLLEKQIGEATRLATDARLKLLETQLEPHMLFNTLANLRVLIGVDPQRAQDMLDRMVAYLRATLAASRASNHPLEREFDRLRDYLELMSVRMGPRMRYTLDLPADLANLNVPALLLQPLVENSIKHGLEPKLEGGSITVRAQRAGSTLTLLVSDTGVGFDAQTALTDGFGLVQVRERLAAAYGEKGSVERNSTPGQGTTVLLHLPTNTNTA